MTYVREVHYDKKMTRKKVKKTNVSTVETTVSFGDRAFSVAAPKLWNSVPYEIRSSENLNQFKSKLKTYLFRIAYF